MRRVVADGVATLTFVEPGGADLPPWQPGAHVDLVINEEVRRQCTRSGDSADKTQWRVVVLRTDGPRGHSRLISDRLVTGAAVRVQGPRNTFPMVASPRHLFIAGGIGITPMLSMLRQAEATGASWQLHRPAVHRGPRYGGDRHAQAKRGGHLGPRRPDLARRPSLDGPRPTAAQMTRG